MQEYTVVINGVDHTFQLDAEHAKRIGAKPVTKPVEKKQAPAPANKARTVANKEG